MLMLNSKFSELELLLGPLCFSCLDETRPICNAAKFRFLVSCGSGQCSHMFHTGLLFDFCCVEYFLKMLFANFLAQLGMVGHLSTREGKQLNGPVEMEIQLFAKKNRGKENKALTGSHKQKRINSGPWPLLHQDIENFLCCTK